MVDRKKQRQLLGYLLGALEDGQRRRIEAQLAGDPDLTAELGRVEESLQPLCAVPRVCQPPPGLARRTCRMIFAYADVFASRKTSPRIARRPGRERARAMSPAAVPPTSALTWGWSDLLVAAGVFLAIAGLIFPAVQSSRMNMRLLACQNNLRQLGQTHAELQQTRGVASEDALAAVGGMRMMPPAPYAIFLHEPNAPDAAPVRAPTPPSLVYRLLPTTLVSLGRNIVSPHQGFTHRVHGQNVLFLDGHAAFFTIAPIADPPSGPAPPDDSLVGPWPSEDAGPAAGSSGLPPIIFVSRPGP